MSALQSLAAMLQPAEAEGGKTFTSAGAIDRVLAAMESRHLARKPASVSEGHQLLAVRRFWESQEVQSFRDAYLLSWGLCVPHRFGAECVLEDTPRLNSVLGGIDKWASGVRPYRRCYQGLVKSYFTYDVSSATNSSARDNWSYLRSYLKERTDTIESEGINPEWVSTATGNRQLFAENPCDPYVKALLDGDSSAVDRLCEHLGIAKTSWFLRELVLAQVKGATKLGDRAFQALMPRLLELLAQNEFLRDRGLIQILDRYSRIPGAHLHQELRDAAVAWWGNPWLPSNETRWGGVLPEAREMVADWLKLEFIETFFTKLAEDGHGDPRRMEFWKRYVKSIGHIEFALGSAARGARERDMVALRKKMTGLIRELDASGTNNAFIMTMGDLIAVEFSGMGNAFYGYDARKELPFNAARPLTLPSTARNSLKQKDIAILRMGHKDGIHGWNRWEEMFEETLRKEFGLKPGVQAARTARTPTAARPVAPPAAATPAEDTVNSDTATDQMVRRFASSRGFEIDDKRPQGGNFWVVAGVEDVAVASALTRWGFRHRPGKGWWR